MVIAQPAPLGKIGVKNFRPNHGCVSAQQKQTMDHSSYLRDACLPLRSELLDVAFGLRANDLRALSVDDLDGLGDERAHHNHADYNHRARLLGNCYRMDHHGPELSAKPRPRCRPADAVSKRDEALFPCLSSPAEPSGNVAWTVRPRGALALATFPRIPQARSQLMCCHQTGGGRHLGLQFALESRPRLSVRSVAARRLLLGRGQPRSSI